MPVFVIKRLKRKMFMRLRRPFMLVQIVLIVLILYLVKRTRERHKVTIPGSVMGPRSAPVLAPADNVDLFEDSAQGVMEENAMIPPEADGAVEELFQNMNIKRYDLFPDSSANQNESVPNDTGLVEPVKAKEPMFKSSQGVVPAPNDIVQGQAAIGNTGGNAGANDMPQGALLTDIVAQEAEPSDSLAQGAEQGNLMAQDANAPIILPQGAEQPNILAQGVPPTNVVPQAVEPSNVGVQDAATFHFPVPGEEVAMGALDGVSGTADSPAQVGSDSSVALDENGLEIIPRPAQMVQLNPMRFSLEVTENMINNFSVALPPLLPNFKNPCWEEEVPDGFTYDDSFFNQCHYILHTNKLKHGAQFKAFEKVLLNRPTNGVRTRLRCFPYFFLIGVGKCGTTDVFDTLKKYFWELAPIFLKEPHYWEWKRCIDKLICRDQQRTPTFAEYLDSFDSAADFIGEKKMIGPDGNPYNPLILGDFTPSTLAFHPCWKLMPGNQGEAEPRYMNAHYIKALRPQTKFIVIMRDPVERVFSNFRMHDRMSAEASHADAQSFHDEMVEVLSYLNNCIKYKSVRACAYSIMKFDFGTHVTNSMYEVFISDWLRIFPKEQFLFLRMEDYMEDRVPNFRRVVKFLELDPMPPEKEMMIGSKAVVNQAPPAAMFNETRKLLQDFYRPMNRRLSQILEDDGWNWGY